MKEDKVFIIAEAGVNHNGDIDLAKKLVDAAIDAGADAVKFQSFKAEKLVTVNAQKADYQKNNTGNGSQYEMLKKLELSYEQHVILKRYCEDKNIFFLSTPFDFESVDLLEGLNIKIYKISSSDLNNIPFLRYIAKLNKPMIVSTGMATLGEVESAVGAIKACGNNNISLLHCTTNYPTSYEDVNLKAMVTMAEAFKLPVGYSDHTLGIEVPIAAVAMGARIIEKHFTLDKGMEGPDHKASLEPHELKHMINSIRNIEKSMGDGIKRCSKSEENTKIAARKSIVAKVDIEEGQLITEDLLTIKRPGNGLKPEYIGVLLGKKAKRKITVDQLIDIIDIE